MEEWYILLMAGAFGGLARGAFGLWKAKDQPDFKMDYGLFAYSILMSAVIGAGAAFALGSDSITTKETFGFGFAGIDLLDSLMGKFIKPKA